MPGAWCSDCFVSRALSKCLYFSNVSWLLSPGSWLLLIVDTVRYSGDHSPHQEMATPRSVVRARMLCWSVLRWSLNCLLWRSGGQITLRPSQPPLPPGVRRRTMYIDTIPELYCQFPLSVPLTEVHHIYTGRGDTNQLSPNWGFVSFKSFLINSVRAAGLMFYNCSLGILNIIIIIIIYIIMLKHIFWY